MKIIKRVFLILQIIVLFVMISYIAVDAYSLIPISKTYGGYVTYRNEPSINVMMPDVYDQPETDFRGVWISNLVSDIGSYANEQQFKSEMATVFKVLKYYNINAMIFHIRMYNDALYKSELNPIASYYKNVNFDEFDPLEWLIKESHRHGIEFHAWMNPYRVARSSIDLETVASEFEDYNIASNAEYLLSGTNYVILNPGEPAVREFLIDTVMEVVRNYDVDAIQFDDYFYDRGVNDSQTITKYNTSGLSIADFRRQQVNIFIEQLSTEMRTYTNQNNRVVQLGISPSGIYRNGTYVPLENYTYDNSGNLTYPLYSNTSGFDHYGEYLYSDTKKWVDNEWIDYILPQSYWSLEHPSAGYADVMDWWNMAVKYKKVNLYSGMGLYMAGEDQAFSWNTNPKEAANQVQYASKLENVKGHAVYSFKHLYNAYSAINIFRENMSIVKNNMWYKPSILPEIETYNPITLPAVEDLKLSKTSAGYRIDFNEMEIAKSYVIYRSNTTLTYQPDEIVDIVGDIGINGKISYIDEVDTSDNYFYGVKPLSKTNTLGESSFLSTITADPNGKLITAGDFTNVYISDNTFYDEEINIQWNKLYPYFGDGIDYQVYKSFDQINWEIVTSSTNPITLSSTTVTQKMTLDNLNSKVYVKIKAFNNLSESISDIYEIDVINKIGTINNFSYSGDLYTSRSIEFKWSLLNLENVNYLVQYSQDLYNWHDITSSINPVVKTEVNGTQSFTLPSVKSAYYYRVVATNSEGKAISNVLYLESYKYLGALNIKVNGAIYSQPTTVDDLNTTILSWKNLNVTGENIFYSTKLSTNLKDWKLAKTVNSKNVLIVGNIESSQQLNFDYRYYTIYAQVEASSENGKSLSPIIELRIENEFLKPEYFMNFIIETQEAFLYTTNIYK